MKVRHAKIEDSLDIFKWRNDRLTRSMFIHSDLVEWEEHAEWFQSGLSDHNKVILVGEDELGKIGVVRIDYDYRKQLGDISINLNPIRRKQRLSSVLLDKSIYLAKPPSAIKLVAKIKQNNSASIRCFSKSGFFHNDTDDDYVYLVKLHQEESFPIEHSLHRLPYQITFLIDKRNNWIEKYLRKSEVFVNSSIYNFQISHDPFQILNQDFVFILGYTKILGPNFLKTNKMNLVVHESDLPRGKGFAPVQWQILDGKKEIPVCLLEATEQVDSGDILGKCTFNLSGYELYEDIRLKQAQATFKVINQFLQSYPNHFRTKQQGESSFYRRRSEMDSELNIEKSLREQFNLLRIGNNEHWPSFFVVDGYKYFLRILDESDFDYKKSDVAKELNIDTSLIEQFNSLHVRNNQQWSSFFVLDGYKYMLEIYKHTNLSS